MKEDYYIIRSGDLVRKGNTIYFKTEDEKRALPVENINALYIFGEVTMNKRFLEFINKKKIPMHFFNHYDFYVGTFFPREYLNSGLLIVKQVQHFLDEEKRMFLAKEILNGAKHNMLSVLKYYLRRGKEVKNFIVEIENYSKNFDNMNDISSLMGLEGNIRKTYYQSFNKILREGFTFEERVKRPPDNMINCLISFGNSLLYRTVLTELYHTYLNPTISYLHKPSERRFSLCLDIAEIYKPIIVDPVIFSLVNKQKINENYFDKKLKYCYLNEKGRTLFLREYDQKLHTTINYEKLKRKVSYKRLIRLECYRLVKHLIEDKKYCSYKKSW